MKRIFAIGILALSVDSVAMQPRGAAPAQPKGDTAARIERVLKGLRPRIEIEGAPVRWSLEERMAAYKAPAVSMAIIDGGRIIWAQGFGVQRIGGPERVSATTLFQAGSVSKAIAASAMLRLVDKGTLSLDANVNSYLTSWKLPENEFTRQEPVTLRRLVNHTGGTTVSGFAGYEVFVPRPTLPELLEGKAPSNSAPVRVDTLPGKAFRYSGGGTSIMQQVLIDVTSVPFEALLQREVLGPLGMKRSAFDQPLPVALVADAAQGHEKDVAVKGGAHIYPELAAAGLWSTPTDLATWAIAMRDAITGRSTTFLSPTTAAQIIGSAVPGRSAEERIGLGVFLNGSGDNLGFSHDGQTEGFVTEVRMSLKSGQGVAIMINMGEGGVGLLREILLAIGSEFGWPDSDTTKIKLVAVDPSLLDPFTGTYAVYNFAGRFLPRIVREGARFFVEGWGVRRELYPQSPTTFIRNDGTPYAFARDTEGRVVMIIGAGTRGVSGIRQ